MIFVNCIGLKNVILVNAQGLSSKKIFLFGVMVACPKGEMEPDCPFRAYANLSYREKMIALENFTTFEVEELLVKHNNCLLNCYNCSFNLDFPMCDKSLIAE